MTLLPERMALSTAVSSLYRETGSGASDTHKYKANEADTQKYKANETYTQKYKDNEADTQKYKANEDLASNTDTGDTTDILADHMDEILEIAQIERTASKSTSVSRKTRYDQPTSDADVTPMLSYASSAFREEPLGRERTLTPIPPLQNTDQWLQRDITGGDSDDGGWGNDVIKSRYKMAMEKITMDKSLSTCADNSPIPPDISKHQVPTKLPALTAEPRNIKKITRKPATRETRTVKQIKTTNKRPHLEKISKKASEANHKLSKPEVQYGRLMRIVVNVGSDLLRLVLYNYLHRQQPPRKLHQFLATNRRRLLAMAATHKIIANRWPVLFPDDDETKSDVQLFDPALVFWLLRYICHLKPPNDFIWKRKPAHEDVTETDDVARIRDMRNFLLNLTTHALYDDEFNRKVTEFNELTKRLSGEKQGKELCKIIDNMTGEAIRVSQNTKHMRLLNEWAEDAGDRQLVAALPSWKSSHDHQEQTKRFLIRHRNPCVYVGTRTFRRAQETLMKHGCVVLNGNVGTGKSTLAMVLMMTHFDEDQCLVISHPDQWQTSVFGGAAVGGAAVGGGAVVLMDDMFGKLALDEDLLERWSERFDEIFESTISRGERNGVKVIITIRQHILDQCYHKLYKHALFAEDRFVDCSSAELSVQEKRTMLNKHLQTSHRFVSKAEIDKAAKGHYSKLGYQECCALFVSLETYVVVGSQFFERPERMLLESLDKFYDGDKYSYLGLVLLLRQPDGMLPRRTLEDSADQAFAKHVVDLASICNVPVSDHLFSFVLNALDSRVGSFVNFSCDEQSYTFLHDSIAVAVLSSFGDKHPEQVLHGLSLSELTDIVYTENTYTNKPSQLFIITIRKQHFHVLTKVFTDHILQGSVVKIGQNRVMRDLDFLHYLFQYLAEMGMLTRVLHSEDTRAKDTRGKRRQGILCAAVDQDVPNVELVSAILKTGLLIDKNKKTKWCHKELQSGLCLAVQHGSLAIYKAFISTGIQPPDILLQHEQYLVNAEITRDLLKRRYWSDEQKDIALLRAARAIRPETEDVVAMLIQEGASVSSIRTGSTSLCEAVKSGKLKTVITLLNNGASVEDRDGTQQTALHLACDWNNIEVVKYLLKRDADVNARDACGLTPFLICAGWGRETIMELLIAKGVNPLVNDQQENNVLHFCAANGQIGILNLVLDKFPQEVDGILVARNRHGWTPLDFAIRCGHLHVTETLVQTIMENVKTIKTPKPPRTFVHTRFYGVKLEDFNLSEKHEYRFLTDTVDRTCFQMPHCHWFIQTGSRDEYEYIRKYVAKYDNKLRQRFAKS